MADVVVNIVVSSVSYKAWLNTSYIGSGLLDANGKPLIKITELGNDQEDAFTEFMEEATRELLKIFLSRQGDVSGVPFEYDGVNAIYRFNEGVPLLPQAAAIKNALYEDAKNALYTYVTILWFKVKFNEAQLTMLMDRYNKLTNNIENHLYRLHD